MFKKISFVAISILCLLSLFKIGQVAAGWNPAISNDTQVFFYPAMTALNQDKSFKVVLKSFLAEPNPNPPDSDVAKPLLVATQRLWSLFLGSFDKSISYPNHHFMNYYVTASLASAFVACIFMGFAFGHPWIGLLTGLLSIFNSWTLSSSYFSTYNAGSLAIAIMAFTFAASKIKKPFLAGVLMSLALIYNQSLIVMIPALLVPMLMSFESWRAKANSIFKYSAGGIVTWTAIEILVKGAEIYSGQDYQSRTYILGRYLHRSLTDAADSFGVYHTFFAPYLFANHSTVVSILLLAALLYAFFDFFKNKKINTLILVVSFFITWLALIEFRNGPKFSRTYVLLLPFANFAILSLANKFWGFDFKIDRKIKAIIIAAIVIPFGYNQYSRIDDLKHAFLDVRDELVRSENPIYFLDKNTYAIIFRILTQEQKMKTGSVKMVSELCEIPADAGIVVLPPRRKSLLNAPDSYQLPIDTDKDIASGNCDKRTWTARVTARLPFFAHYPFLSFEDMLETTALIQSHAFKWDDYKNGQGRVSFWEVSFVPISSSVKQTKLQ